MAHPDSYREYSEVDNGSVAHPDSYREYSEADNGSVAHPDSYREYSEVDNGSVAQLYSASDFGSEGWGLESLRGHKVIQKLHPTKVWGFFYG